MSDRELPDESDECVGCRGTTRSRFRFDTGIILDPWDVACCSECERDGSLTRWLTAELEKWADSNPSMVKLPDGKWTKKEWTKKDDYEH